VAAKGDSLWTGIVHKQGGKCGSSECLFSGAVLFVKEELPVDSSD
jgi:hypothetical protein